MAARSALGLDPADARLRRFARIVEEADLHGLAFQHLALCTRRAWLHLSRIDYTHLDRRMALGAVSHDLHRTRDRSTTGLMGLAPDRIDWARRRVHEAKGGAGAKDAVSLQTAFYALVLTVASGEAWEAATDILPERRSRTVTVDGTLLDRMLGMAERLAALRERAKPPEAERKPICRTCSYRVLCGYG
jgi:CRISPR-associated exonuclease Cas4